MEEVENLPAGPEASDRVPGPPPAPSFARLSDVALQLRWYLWHYPERREAPPDELRREMWGHPPLYRMVRTEEISEALRELAELEKAGEADM